MKVLAITNLFGFPWDPTRGMYNQQQFTRLARHVDLRVLVAVPWPDALRHLRAYIAARRCQQQRNSGIDYFIFWYPPRMLQTMHPLFFFLSLVFQRPGTLFLRRWQVLLGSWAFPDGVATAAVGRMVGTPVLLKVHGTDINDYLSRPGRRWQILAAMRHSRAVLAVSEALRSRLVRAGVPAARVTVLYNGVDADLFRPAVHADDRAAARLHAGLANDDELLLFVGNLKPAKGCIDLLEAFVALASRPGPRLCLAFIGDGPAAAAMRQRVASAGLAERVRLLGKLDHHQLPAWYAAARLVCLPSHAEGVPNVLLEAMSCGTPVVASCVGGVPEVVPAFAGVLMPPQDPVALGAALQAALARQWEPARIAAHARQFGWQANVDGLRTLLAQVAGPVPMQQVQP
jgi:glycosyltransferase involved in cell wall biosynthesis